MTTLENALCPQSGEGIEMRLCHAFLGCLILTVLPNAVYGQATGLPAMCTNVLNDVSARVYEISQRYSREGQAGSQAFAQEAEQIKKDRPTPGIEGGLQMDIDVSMQRHHVYIDLPQVTMNTQEFSFDYPTIEMRPTEWSWETLTWVTRTECRPGLDEYVCEDQGTYTDDFGNEFWKAPTCYTRRGADVCLDVPHPEKRTETATFDNPVVVMKPVAFKMDVPEFTMAPQKIIVDRPSITVKNLTVETAKTQKRAEALKAKSGEYQTNLSQRMQNETKAVYGDVLTKSQACVETEFVTVPALPELAVFGTNLRQARMAAATAIEALAQDLEANGVPVAKRDPLAADMTENIECMIRILSGRPELIEWLDRQRSLYAVSAYAPIG